MVVVHECSKMNHYHSKPYQERRAVLGVATPRHRGIRTIHADPRRHILRVRYLAFIAFRLVVEAVITNVLEPLMRVVWPLFEVMRGLHHNASMVGPLGHACVCVRRHQPGTESDRASRSQAMPYDMMPIITLIARGTVESKVGWRGEKGELPLRLKRLSNVQG